jgi:L-lysine 6-transaminase
VGDGFQHGLQELGDRYPDVVSNVRGRGLMCALDLPDTEHRDRVVSGLRDERVLVLPCGDRSVRFRPALSVTEDEVRTGLAALDRVIFGLAPAPHAVKPSVTPTDQGQ